VVVVVAAVMIVVAMVMIAAVLVELVILIARGTFWALRLLKRRFFHAARHEQPSAPGSNASW
jgi:hypothetical protein